MQGYLWFLKSPTVEQEAEPLAIKLLSCLTISQYWLWEQTPSLHLRGHFRLSSVMKFIVRASTGYSSMGLNCWGTSRDALSSSLFLSVHIHVSLVHITDLSSFPKSLCSLASQVPMDGGPAAVVLISSPSSLSLLLLLLLYS